MAKDKKQNVRYLAQSRGVKEKMPNNVIVATAIGFAVFLASFFAMTFLGALLIAKGPDPARLIPFVSAISMTASAIIGGIVTAKKSQRSGGISALAFLFSVTLSVLIMTVTHLGEGSTPLWQSLLLKIPVILGAFFGGFIGSMKKKEKSLYAKYKKQ